MEYILFIHKNTDSSPTQEQWESFFIEAKKGKFFQGGSEIANPLQIGNKQVPKITNTIGGFMRFDTEDLNEVLELLKKHPVLVEGGTVELCEMPRS